MEIRDYQKEDEHSWIQCRVLSFLNTSYFDDVQNERETYENPVLQLVAVEGEKVIGFLDCEYEQEKGALCYLKGERGSVIWHLGVLPEYQNNGIASRLFEVTKERLQRVGIKRVEVWTQDDKISNAWYLAKGFTLKNCYLNAYLSGSLSDEAIKTYLNLKECGEILSIRSLNFEAPLERRKELEAICYRLHEVRMYELIL